MFDIFPHLETDRLQLRSLIADDLDFVFHHFADSDIHRFLFDEEPVSTRAQAQAIIDFYTEPKDTSYNRWVLVLKSEARPIGTCGYHKWMKQHRRAEIGYDLAKSSWHKGLMKEALEAVIRFGFTQMSLNRIGAIVHPKNVASVKLLKRLGFQKEGLLKDLYLKDGGFHDHWLLALLQRDWQAE